MFRSSRRRALAALLLVPVVAVAARPVRPAHGPAPTRELAVVATDFAFRAADTVPAGRLRVRFRNDGAEMHFLQLVRIGEGHTVAEYRERVAAKEYLPAWVTPVGGPGVPPPGGATEVVADLEAGRYAMICFVSSPDGVSHAMKGMVRELVVRPVVRPAAATPEPRADVRIALHDYAFELSTPLRRGRQVVRVENVAVQPHEVGLIRLLPGKTVNDAFAWEKTHTGPPPFIPAGGALSLAQGRVNWVTLDLEPGDYMLFCFVPDATDGKPHVVHGMLKQVHVD